MHVPPKTSTIVLVGKWNPFILTPQWVGKHIFEEDKIEGEVALGPLVALRLRGPGAEIAPTRDRVTISAEESTPEGLDCIERLGRKLLKMLPHTPIDAVGVNHAFVEDVAGADIVSLFNCDDKDKLPREMPVETIEIGRRLSGDGYKLNLKLSNEQGSEVVRFDFNFHYDIHRSLHGGEGDILEEGAVNRHFDFAKKLLVSGYGLELDDEDQEEESDDS